MNNMQWYFFFILRILLSFELCGASGIASLNLTHLSDFNAFLFTKHLTVCLDEPNGSSTDITQCRIGNYTATIDFLYQITFGKDIGGTPNPTEFIFHTWPGSILLKVSISRIFSVTNLSTEVQMEPSRSRAEKKWKDFYAKDHQTQLDFQMAVFCDENWYGPNCTVNCAPSNSEDSHYSCKSDGGKQCDENWYGQNCDVYCKPSDGQQCPPGYVRQWVLKGVPLNTNVIKMVDNNSSTCLELENLTVTTTPLVVILDGQAVNNFTKIQIALKGFDLYCNVFNAGCDKLAMLVYARSTKVDLHNDTCNPLCGTEAVCMLISEMATGGQCHFICECPPGGCNEMVFLFHEVLIQPGKVMKVCEIEMTGLP